MSEGVAMLPNFSSSGIRFNDSFFSEPTRLAGWLPPRFTGLFVIMACDPNWAPRPFQPLYFGEFGNNSSFGNPGVGHLLVSVLPLPFSTNAQRLALRNELINSYNPVLQNRMPAAAQPEMSLLLAQLEKVLLLLGNIHKQYEPQPVPAHRPIGFLPDAVPEST
jgi:hypothetical protein